MMKKLASTLGLLLFLATLSFSQKIAYVDVSKILENLGEYNKAQEDLEKIAAQWRQEIAQDYDVIKGLYNRYQAEQVLLSDEQRKQREDEIMEKEKDVREKQKVKFGPDGDLFKKRQELVQPIQDKVYGAIESYANENAFDFIFDKGSSAGIIFSNPRYDKTDDILKQLGAKK
ncbi:MAG TPA: OmpH family outer membrane protein [Saprospiraceae bacterium]|nr:OmpH family outer membrane protein [Saprospiraceae bacterium]